MKTGLGKVEKLRGADNWQEWRFVIRTLLEKDDILQVCDGTFVKPVLNETSPYYHMLESINHEKIATWTKMNNAAKCLIITTLGSEPLQLIMNCDTAKDMWEKLHSVFDVKLDESLSLIQKEYFGYHWNPTENVAQHVLRLEQMISKMKAHGGNTSVITTINTERLDTGVLPREENDDYDAQERMKVLSGPLPEMGTLTAMTSTMIAQANSKSKSRTKKEEKSKEKDKSDKTGEEGKKKKQRRRRRKIVIKVQENTKVRRKRRNRIKEAEEEPSRRYSVMDSSSRMAQETQTSTTKTDQLLCYVETILKNQKKIEAHLYTLLKLHQDCQTKLSDIEVQVTVLQQARKNPPIFKFT